MKKIVLFNKSAAATAAAMPQNQKNIKNRSRPYSLATLQGNNSAKINIR